MTKTGGLDYYAQRMHSRMQNRFNRHINMMASGGMPRGKLLMRWIAKPRAMGLMQRLSDQLQHDNPNWVGSLHTIMKLIHKGANKTNKEPKAKIKHLDYLVKQTKHKKSFDPPESYLILFEKSYNEMIGGQDVLENYERLGFLLGEYVASVIYNKAVAPRGSRTDAKTRDVQSTPLPPILTGEHIKPLVLTKFSKEKKVEPNPFEEVLQSPKHSYAEHAFEHEKVGRQMGKQIGLMGVGGEVNADTMKHFDDAVERRYGVRNGSILLHKIAQHVGDPQDALHLTTSGLHYFLEPTENNDTKKGKELWGDLVALTNATSKLHPNGTKPKPETIHGLVYNHVRGQGITPVRLMETEGV
jgi:hypothetical protein